MEKKKRKTKPESKPFTAEALAEYLKNFDKNAQLHITILQRRGNSVTGYPVKGFTLITDGPYPHFCLEVDRGVKVTKDMIEEAKAEGEQ